MVGTAVLSHLMYKNFPDGILRHWTPSNKDDSVKASLEDPPVTNVTNEEELSVKSILATGVGKLMAACVAKIKMERNKESVIFFMIIMCVILKLLEINLQNKNINNVLNVLN